MEVQELRSTDRFVAGAPIPATYGSATVAIVNISSQGLQIAHSQPLRLGSKARLWFRHGDVAVNAQGLTIWSRFSKPADPSDRNVYRSGIRIESDPAEFSLALQTLIDRRVVEPDSESLDRKRQRLRSRNADKTSKLVVKGFKPDADIPTDQALLIQHARERLRGNPEEALKWYNRAKYAMTANGTYIATEAIPNREDVLAVWEYLERTVDLPTIVTVFEQMRKA